MRVFVESFGTLNEKLDESGYLIEENSTLLQLIEQINCSLDGDDFINALLTPDKSSLGPYVFATINDQNVYQLGGIDKMLKDGDEIFIIQADMVGG